MKENKLIRDLLGNPIPQHYNVEKGVFIANTNGTGDATNVDFSKIKMLRDLLGSPIPQYYDVGQGKFVPSTSEGSGGGGEVGPQGPPGEKGEPGEPGPPGSDANVTSENITNALGFTPASSTDLTEEVERLTTHLDKKATDVVRPHGMGSIASKNYETGIWTPKIYDAGAPSDEGTYSSRMGTYVKVGDLIYITGEVILGTKGTIGDASSIYLGGLPFNSSSDTSVLNVITDNVQDTVMDIRVNTLPAPYFLIKKRVGSGHQNLNGVDINQNFTIKISGWYKIT